MEKEMKGGLKVKARSSSTGLYRILMQDPQVRYGVKKESRASFSSHVIWVYCSVRQNDIARGESEKSSTSIPFNQSINKISRDVVLRAS